MITITKFLRKGALAPAILRQAQEVLMNIEERRHPPHHLNLPDGQELHMQLDADTVLHDGDILLSDNNRFFSVRAATQELIKISAPDARSLARAAYHLASQHVALELGDDYLYCEPNTELEHLVAELGLSTSKVEAAFIPEAAIASAHKHTASCGHDHHHHDQSCGHAHDHNHEHKHDHQHAHQHGHSCGHDHSHEHSHGHKHEHDHEHKHDHKCGHQH